MPCRVLREAARRHEQEGWRAAKPRKNASLTVPACGSQAPAGCAGNEGQNAENPVPGGRLLFEHVDDVSQIVPPKAEHGADMQHAHALKLVRRTTSRAAAGLAVEAVSTHPSADHRLPVLRKLYGEEDRAHVR